MVNLIARIVETLATTRATRESKAHAIRKAHRLTREASEHAERQARRSMRDRTEYPFHA